MKIKAFRIQYFRSIKDTDWQSFSTDNINSIIGQNESGKTSLLNGLFAFYSGIITNDDIRLDGLPEISCQFEISASEFDSIFEEIVVPEATTNLFSDGKLLFTLTRFWDSALKSDIRLDTEELLTLLTSVDPVPATGASPENAQIPIEQEDSSKSSESSEALLDIETFINYVEGILPEFVFFEDFSHLIPNRIDLEDLLTENKDVEGYYGAKNFFHIAGLDLKTLDVHNIESERIVTSKLDAASDKITQQFQKFWNQRIGKNNRTVMKVEINRYDASVAEKSGKPYISFWVKDGKDNNTRLTPKQRSNGFRWFLSFFLQLKAFSLVNNNVEYNDFPVFLIDEPGKDLHEKAQEDVLKLFEDLKSNMTIIFSTHNPKLLDPNNIHRILAIQREDVEDVNCDTIVLNAHKLGSASSDTLSPLYSVMGSNFSRQTVIKEHNNVVLEEISAFYYLTAFKHLLGETAEMNFLAAVGVSNIRLLANLLLGWGLNFGIVVDDEPSGRTAYKDIKRDFYKDNDNETNKHMIKIKGCKGIEDIFSKGDFKKYVLKSSQNYSVENSEYAKKFSKAILALQFRNDVLNNAIKLNDLSAATKRKIETTLRDIKSILS